MNTPPVITRINVSRACIDGASKKNSHRCMIADAIRAKLPKAQFIVVDVQSIRFTDPTTKLRHTYFTPHKAQQRLIAFDQGRNVTPFTMSLLQGVTRKSGWSAAHPNSSRKGKKFRKTGEWKGAKPKREREFGLRKLTV